MQFPFLPLLLYLQSNDHLLSGMCRQRPSVLLTCPGKYISGALVKGILNKASSLYGCLHNSHRLWCSKQHRPNGLFHMSVKSLIHFGCFLIPSYFHRQVLHEVCCAFIMWHIVSALNCSKYYCMRNSSLNLAVDYMYLSLLELLILKMRSQSSVVTLVTRVWAG